MMRPPHVEKVISVADSEMPKKYHCTNKKHWSIEEYEFHDAGK